MDMDKLISHVYARKALWDQTLKDYHNREIHRKLWNEIAKEMGETYEYVKNRWRSLRDGFRRECIKASKGKLDDSSKWVYYDSLLFLKNSINSRFIGRLESNAIVDTFSETNDTAILPCKNEMIELSVDPLYQDSESEMEEPRNKRKRGSNLDIDESTDKSFLNRPEIGMDPDYLFLLSLYDELKKVPEERRLMTKIKIQQLLLEQQMDDDTNYIKIETE